MNYSYNLNTGKLVSLLFLTFYLYSCSSTKKIIIEKKDKSQVESYYIKNNINLNTVLFIKSIQDYKSLDAIEFTSIPDVFIFDNKGKLINFNDEEKNSCFSEPINFIENIHKKNFGTNNIIKLTDYLELFSSNDEVGSALKKNDIEYFIFVNSATFTDDLNQKRFDDMKRVKSENRKIFFVNLDLLNEWFR
jgi:hypothetical protein